MRGGLFRVKYSPIYAPVAYLAETKLSDFYLYCRCYVPCSYLLPYYRLARC